MEYGSGWLCRGRDADGLGLSRRELPPCFTTSVLRPLCSVFRPLGIGLIDVTIEVHVAQRGVLSRVVAAAEADLIAGALGIDERTALIVGDGILRVEGAGNVWRVLPTDRGVLVSTVGA